jgi:hypothetical protein
MEKSDRGREAEATLKKDKVYIEVDARESEVRGKEGYRGKVVTVSTMRENLAQPWDCRHCTKRPKDCVVRPLSVSCLSLSDECKQRPHVRDDYPHQLSPSTPTCNPHPSAEKRRVRKRGGRLLKDGLFKPLKKMKHRHLLRRFWRYLWLLHVSSKPALIS